MDTIDILKPHEYSKELFEQAETKLMILEQKLSLAKIPVFILFEGLCGSGRSGCISGLIRSLDPRIFDVFSCYEEGENENLPFIVPYARNIPKYGDITFFNPSYYTGALLKSNTKASLREKIDTINGFEAALCADGYIILKFFININKKTQKNRLDAKKKSSLHIPKSILADTDKYEQNMKSFKQIIEKTNTNHAKWIIADGENRKKARLSIADKIAAELSSALEEREKGEKLCNIEKKRTFDILPHTKISEISLSKDIDDSEYTKKLRSLQRELSGISNELYKKGVPMVIAFEGNDAAGKGGNIKRLARALDPRIYRVIPVGAPSEDELLHHYLWRFFTKLPEKGKITVFDRTWYGRVLVEKVEKLTSEKRIESAYDEINSFEYMLCKNGVLLLKFWLAIDKDEQLKRFQARQNTPEKQWKITDEDWRNREKWDEYAAAVDIMLSKTNTDFAPWTIIESNCKRFGRIKMLETVVSAAQQKLEK